MAQTDSHVLILNGAQHVGRLTEAWVTSHHYTYDFTTAAPAGCPSGTQANAGLNTNRIRLLDQTSSGTAETGYCYDPADRILATTGATSVSTISYDTHGNTLSYIHGGTTTTLGWDGADRNTTARVTGADPAEISYARDATDRLIRRDASTGDTTATVLYAYTSDGDSADLALTSDQRLATRSISLPGGVLYTLRGGAAQPTWDHPTVRGDLCLTTDPTGRQVGALRTYTPYGEPLTTAGVVDPDNVPDNQPGQMDHGWLGQHQRPYEHAGTLSLVQMGARPYSPLLGRFLSVDPEDGGSANDYDYVLGDPINTTDLDGRAPWVPIVVWAACKAFCKSAWRGGVRFAKWGARHTWKGIKWVRNQVRSGFTWAYLKARDKIRDTVGKIRKVTRRAASTTKAWWKTTGGPQSDDASRVRGAFWHRWHLTCMFPVGCGTAPPALDV